MSTLAANVPAPGKDKEVDDLVKLSEKILKAGPVEYDPNHVREAMARYVARQRGQSLEDAFGTGITAAKRKRVAKAVDRKLSVDAIKAAMDKAKAEGGPYFWVDKDNMSTIRGAIALRELGLPINLMIVGPSGYGKTTVAYRLAEEMKKPIYAINAATATTEEAWLGRMHIDDDGTRYEQSEFLKWVEGVEYEPGIILIDEASRIHPSRMNTLFGLFDWQQRIFVPGLKRYIYLHPGNIIIATANIGSEYGGTARMDKAFKERFAFTIHQGPPPKDEEIKVITSSTGLDDTTAGHLVDIADATRKRADLQELTHPITTRALLDMARAVSIGLPLLTAAESTVLEIFDREGGPESDYAKVKLLIQAKDKGN